MKKVKSKKAKLMSNFGIALLAIAFLYFLFRGPYLSNFTKRLIIPTLENATQERIKIGTAVINLFPFYVQGKSVKVLDNDGNRLLWISKTRAYIDLLGLLSGEVRIRKLWLKEPRLTITRSELEKVLQNVNTYMSGGAEGEGRFEVVLKNVELVDGILDINDVEGQKSFRGTGMAFNMTSKKRVSANLSFNDILVKLPGMNEIEGDFQAKGSMDDEKIEVKHLAVRAYESSLETNGEIFLTPDGLLKEGALEAKADIEVESINRLFDLKAGKDGKIMLDGSLGLRPQEKSSWPLISLHMNTDVSFHLETLMEIIKVRQNIGGAVTARAMLTGTYPDVELQGRARLEKALFAGFPIDDAEGTLSYRELKFALNDFTAHTYDGVGKGDAHITIPYGEYNVTADVSGISSPKLFSFIKWDAPFSSGDISGRVQLERQRGHGLDITADLSYLNTGEIAGNFFDRVEEIDTSLEFSDKNLMLENTVLKTAYSDLYLNGALDFRSRAMDLALELQSADMSDMTAPFYTGFIAPARFSGSASGPINDPSIKGHLQVETGSVHGIAFSEADAEFEYNARSLHVSQLQVQHEGAASQGSGRIAFRKSEGLFSFKDPHYEGEISLRNVELHPFVSVAYRELPLSGKVSGSLSFTGDHLDYVSKGSLSIKGSDIYGQPIDSIKFKAVLDPEKIVFDSLETDIGASRASGRGWYSFNNMFEIHVESEKFDTCGIDYLDRYPLSADMAFELKGTGHIYDPDISFSADILQGYWKEVKIGSGEVDGALKNRRLAASGHIMDGKVDAVGSVVISERPEWWADIEIEQGMYGDLVKSLFEEAPEDLTLSLAGNLKLNGLGDNMQLQASLAQLGLGLYGYSLKNNEDVILEMKNRHMTFHAFDLRGEKGEVSAEGNMEIGGEYDVTLYGSLDVDPLVGLLPEELTSLKGRSSFNLDLKGPWRKPVFTGKVTLEDTVATLSNLIYRIGPVNGTFVIDEERITFDSVKSGFAGGSVILSGVGYLDGYALNKLYISAILNEIKVRPIEKVNAAFDGRLFYEFSSKGSFLSGNLDIRKAKYAKKVEFRSFMSGLNEIKTGDADYASFLSGTELNIHISGMDNILIDNNIARTPVKIALTLMGTIDKKGLLGRVEAEEGEIFFRSNEFKILEGSSVEFVDAQSIAPFFHILAETYINDYYIKLTLDGTVDRFAISLFSDPPLPEEEILTLLTFGQVKREVRGFESGLAASEAASILTGDLQDAVEDRFKSITGFERFKIEPHTTRSGAFGSKFTVGKRVMEDKLFFIYSTSIGTTEEHMMRLEYKLNKNVSVVGSRDEIGDTGADVRYRFEFK